MKLKIIVTITLVMALWTGGNAQKSVEVKSGNLYSIEIPGFLDVTDDLTDDTTAIQYQNELLEYFFYAIYEPKAEVLNIYTENEVDLSEGLLMNYSGYFANAYLNKLEDLTHNEYFLDTIAGAPCLVYELAGTLNSIPISYVLTFIEGKEHLYMLVHYSDVEDRVRYLPMIYNTIASFREL